MILHTPRHGRLLWWLAVLLAVAALGLIGHRVYMRYFNGPDRDQAEMDRARNADLNRPRGAAADWPQWLGPHRDGSISGEGLLVDWPADLLSTRKKWEADVGEGYSAVVVADGRAILIFAEGGDEVVRCWDAATGQKRWDFRYPARYESREGSGPRSTPAIDGNRVYTVGGTGVMHCLDVTNGAHVWRVDLLETFGAKNTQWGISNSPLIEGDLVYAQPGGKNDKAIVALDKSTGQVRWTSEGDPAGYSSPVISTIGGVRQALFLTGTALVSLDPKTGQRLWRHDWKTQHEANVATPIVLKDYVFLSSGYGKGCTLLRINEADGRFEPRLVYRSRTMRNHMATSVYRLDHVYGFDEGELICMNLKEDTRHWDESKFGKGSVLLAGDQLIIQGESGQLGVVEATPAGYREKAFYQVFDVGSRGRCWSMPALAQGRLYLRGPKKVVCLDVTR